LMLGYLKNPTLTLGNHDKSFKVFWVQITRGLYHIKATCRDTYFSK
jgi:hypothetical protein